MNRKERMLTALLIALPMAASARQAPAAPSSAQAEPPAVVETARAALPRPYQVGVTAVLMPVGRVRSGMSGENSSYPATAAYGLVPTIDRRLSRHLTLGFALPVLFNVNQDVYPQAPPSTEIEAQVRLGAWFPVGERLRLFGYAAPGAFVMVVPELSFGRDNPMGLVAATGGGATWALADRWFLSGEIGAEVGFRIGQYTAAAYPEASAFLHAGMGVGVAF